MQNVKDVEEYIRPRPKFPVEIVEGIVLYVLLAYIPWGWIALGALVHLLRKTNSLIGCITVIISVIITIWWLPFVAIWCFY